MVIDNLNIDDITFEELVIQAKKKIPLYSKLWTDFNSSDPGITFIELFAWLAEMQIYQLNKITEKNYLRFLKLLGISPNTNTKSLLHLSISSSSNNITSPINITRELRFISFQFQDNTNKNVICESEENVVLMPINIRQIISIFNSAAKDVTNICNHVDGTYFPIFGNFPEIGNLFYIGLDCPGLESIQNNKQIQNLSQVKVHISFYLYEDDLPRIGEHNDERIQLSYSKRVKWEYGKVNKYGHLNWIELDKCTNEFNDDTYGLSKNGRITFNLPFSKNDKSSIVFTSFRNNIHNVRNLQNQENRKSIKDNTFEKQFWIRCSIISDNYEIPPRIDGVIPNTIYAYLGETIEEIMERRNDLIVKPTGDEIITMDSLLNFPTDESNGAPNQSFNLHNNFIKKNSNNDEFNVKQGNFRKNQSSLENYYYCNKIPIGDTIPISEVFSIESVIDSEEERNQNKSKLNYKIVNDLISSNPNDNHCVVDMINGIVIFGDGEKGKIPPKGTKIKIKYRSGNIGFSSIPLNSQFKIVSDNFDDGYDGIFAVNPIPIMTENKKEKIEDAVSRAKILLQTPNNAVTLEDFEYLAKNTPGIRVAKVKAFISSTEPNTVDIVVVPYSFSNNPQPTKEFLLNVFKHIDMHRIITTQVNVLPPTYVGLFIKAKLEINSTMNSNRIKEKVIAALSDFLNPIRKNTDYNLKWTEKKKDNQEDGWKFGKYVYKTELYSIIMKVDGIKSILDLSLSTSSGNDYLFYDKEGNIIINKQSLVFLENCTIDFISS